MDKKEFIKEMGMLEIIDNSNVLSRISKDELYELIYGYYFENFTAVDAEKKYNYTPNSNYLYQDFPQVVLPYECDYEDGMYIGKFASKTYLSINGEESWSSVSRLLTDVKCGVCGHNPSVSYDKCSCMNCAKEKEEQVKNDLELIYETYAPENFSEMDQTDMNNRDKFLLTILLKNNIMEDYSSIMPLCASGNKLSPDEAFDISLLKRLDNNNVIRVSQNSPISAFTKDNFPNAFYVNKVYYDLNLKLVNETNEELIDKFMFIRSASQYIEDKDLICALIKEAMYLELLEYLIYSMSIVGLGDDFNPGDKTKSVLNRITEVFSISEGWSLIYSSVNIGLRMQKEKNYSKKRTRNAIISVLASNIDKAIADNWELKKFGRNYDLPASTLSKTLFNELLKIGTKYTELTYDQLINKAYGDTNT